ncbi:hypothetical protein PMG11_09908 [Penicillium brasilianum]|uniref:Zn(2)-C6 fungal-type domain-containing protein n=1 Tax=Penicillium brasilianum TaxID=104259 RepID=A0A0F7TXH1_PENBI|nr:hypothetical protein PMG11_09908 [Penicillium brasilianum]
MSDEAAVRSAGSPARRRPLACLRCRRRKVRCDGASPACSNCTRAGAECFEGRSESAISRSRLHYLENRVRELESGQSSSNTHSGERSLNSVDTTRSQSAASIETHGAEPRSQPPQPNCVAPDMHQHVEQQRSALSQPSDFPLPAARRFSRDRMQPSLGNGGPGTSVLINEAAVPSPSGSSSSHITRDQPIVHEVGLLSLGNALDPKYLGPSSGVTFARLIYESVPQSQGLPLSFARPLYHDQSNGEAAEKHGSNEFPHVELPSIAEYQQYAEVYFSMSTFYPFISQEEFHLLFQQVFQFSKTSVWNCRLPLTIALAQVYLVLSLGARFLEYKLGNNFPSQDLFGQGMNFASKMNLHESVEGVQILLLLAQHSLFCPEGLNAWYLVHTIIASCLDLGLQRQDNYDWRNDTPSQRKIRDLRSAIFWSAYSMDRTLTVILGRPLTLRDEAIDRGFPGFDGNLEVESGATEWKSSNSASQGSVSVSAPEPYTAFIYSLRFDRIIAEVKLMLYRVSRSPKRFPWPQDLSLWRQEAQDSCVALLREAQSHQQNHIIGSAGALSVVALQRLELKYHQCIMLLNRPSPQIPHPSFEATQASFASAMGIIATYADLQRFSNMDFSWLTAHSIFVASITVIYYLWFCPLVRGNDPLDACLHRVEQAHQLLTILGRSWSVALKASGKLEKLIKSTKDHYEGMAGARAPPFGDWADGNPGIAPRTDAELDRSATSMPLPDVGNVLIDELGILRDLFDLGWLEDFSDNQHQPSFGGLMDLR